MKNYLFKIKYDGSSFHGWQIQPNAVTVQQCLKEAFEAIFSQNVNVNGCSRTDAGVHANEFCFNVRLETKMTPDRIITAINSKMPPSATVYACCEAEYDFHARFDCKGKEYIYRILNSEYPDPFLRDRASHYRYKLDEKQLDREAKSFIGTHDFSAFCAAGSTVDSKVRTVYDCSVERIGDEVIFRISGDGFLYNMVRIMVGTLIDISRGRISEGSIPEIIKSKDRNKAGVTAAACGLYLNKIFYEEK